MGNCHRDAEASRQAVPLVPLAPAPIHFHLKRAISLISSSQHPLLPLQQVRPDPGVVLRRRVVLRRGDVPNKKPDPLIDRNCYSAPSATIGLTRVARHAGATAAMTATPSNAIAAPIAITGSRADVWNSIG